MKKHYLFLLLVFGMAQAQIVNIPDLAFKAKLLSASPSNNVAKHRVYPGSYYVSVAIDTNGDGQIQVTEAMEIDKLDVSNAGISDLTGIASFGALKELRCSHNMLSTLNVGNLTVSGLYCDYNNLSSLSFDGSSIADLNCAHNQLISLDLNGVGEDSEVNLDCSYNQLGEITFGPLCKMYSFNCSHNNLTVLDFANKMVQKDLNCSYNHIIQLDMSGLNAYGIVDCSHNDLTSLFLPAVPINYFDESYVYCDHNQLTALVLPRQYQDVDCSYNALTHFEMNQQLHMGQLMIHHNALTHLQAKWVFYIDCSYNQLVNLDLSNAGIEGANVSHNQLLSLNLKNAISFSQSWLEDNPNLAYVCVNSQYVPLLQQYGAALGYNLEVNSYCSEASSLVYPVSGYIRYDEDSNGCTASDPGIPGFRLDVTAPNGYHSIEVCDSMGYYHFSLSPGSYTVTPILPSNFISNPASWTVEIPAANTEESYDFCVSSVGNEHNLKVVLVSGAPLVPGFGTSIIVKVWNLSPQPELGYLTLDYDDERMAVNGAQPAADFNVAGTLGWDVPTIPSFGNRILYAGFLLNSPLDNPAVNVGDILSFTATASTSDGVDVYPADNVKTVHLTVVNAIDPNDKTCLEGNTIGMEMAGQYLQYLIRFENTGNYPAQIVTVEDMIDTTKFDISTLEPLDGSHAFTTRITGNKVEFIFNNIMLPFDDANNDGWVLFRIKTKPTLVLGDSVSNTAGIYFNFNPPVITNTATTTFATMGIDSHFDTAFTLWPNPASDVVKIESKRGETITSVSVYNTLGQELLREKGSDLRSVNVSGLATGTYVITIATDQSKSSTQLVKK